MKKMTYKIAGITIILALAWGSPTPVTAADDAARGYMPGQRVLLDAHNCYPYQGRWADRLERALGTGPPLAVEQDLVWFTDPDTGVARSIVSHGKPFTGKEPSLESYFFESIRSLVEEALANGNSGDWPLVTLNLDIKNNTIEHTRVVWENLKRYEAWLTTAKKSGDIARVGRLDLKPVLVLSKGNGAEFQAFYEEVPVGEKLLVFGVGQSGSGTAPQEIMPKPSDNFRRWWNFSWAVVEEGGQRRAGDWTEADAERLQALVDRAHEAGYWIRFYTLDGWSGRGDMGWRIGYNFGSKEAAVLRWRAAIGAGVDFIASDHYEDVAEALKSAR